MYILILKKQREEEIRKPLIDRLITPVYPFANIQNIFIQY